MDVADSRTGPKQIKDDAGERCQKLFQDFLEEFRNEQGELKHLEDARHLVKPERSTLEISFADVQNYNQSLATVIQENYYRFYPYLCHAVRNFVKDRVEVSIAKELYVSFVGIPTLHKVRELTTTKIGGLLRICGQVVRTHPVHPELVRGTFTCLDCQAVIKDIEQQFKYTQPTICCNPVCSNRSRFLLDIKKSKFVDFQKVRIQETQAELPRGSIPRSVEVIVRAEAVEKAQPGDRCDFTGTLIVVPDVSQLATQGVRTESSVRHKGMEGFETEGVRGLKALGVRELSYRMAFLACSVTYSSTQYSGREFSSDMTAEDLKKQMTEKEWEKVYNMSQDKNLYNSLLNSLFPTIHGNDEVKRGILLLLFGGVPKKTIEHTTLRGDINLCIVGDPSTAKSQFLKQVADFSPRAVYTSGKASSAAGLTAAVVKDEESQEFVIEAGALMLADNGVCCIDEFDKMDPRDQVAIHEAMEQQTISITKAGVKASLNARTSILAAANPVGGRYDRTKSLKQNISLGAPIMSRFDLFFILVDECNEITDYAIARRIVDLHTNNGENIERIYTLEEIQRYLLFARQFKPVLTSEAEKQLVEHYKRLRQRDATGAAKSSWRITVRQLESLIRLSEALARLHCSEEVLSRHVKEAYRLLNKSIIRVEQPDINLYEEEEEQVEINDINGYADDEKMDVDGEQPKESSPSKKPEAEPHREPKMIKLSYESYKSLSNLLVMYLLREESKVEQSGTQGIKQSDLINWYLKEIESEIDSEEELITKKLTVERVIDRLIQHDHVIIPLSKQGLKGDSEEMEEEDPVLVVHPNYVPESF